MIALSMIALYQDFMNSDSFCNLYRKKVVYLQRHKNVKTVKTTVAACFGSCMYANRTGVRFVENRGALHAISSKISGIF